MSERVQVDLRKVAKLPTWMRASFVLAAAGVPPAAVLSPYFFRRFRDRLLIDTGCDVSRLSFISLDRFTDFLKAFYSVTPFVVEPPSLVYAVAMAVYVSSPDDGQVEFVLGDRVDFWEATFRYYLAISPSVLH
jgi:hypothetical protein